MLFAIRPRREKFVHSARQAVMMNSSFRQVNLSGQGGFFMSAGGDEKWTEISSEKNS